MVVHAPIPYDGRVMAQARAAIRNGFDVDIVSLRTPGEASVELLEDGVQVFRLPLRHARGSGLPAVVREYLAFTFLALAKVGVLHVRRRYDLIEVHNPPDFLMLAALVPRLAGGKIILDIHDLAPDMFDSRFGGRRGARIADRALKGIEHAATRAADHVLTVHEPYRQELIARGVPADKITVVMNSVDEQLLPHPSLETSKEEFRVVYHGTVTPHYGVELLVGAAEIASAAVPNLRLEIYGRGDSIHTASERASASGFSDRLSLVGELPLAEVLRRVNGASAGVVPNLPTRLNRFALSTKLFEYVALGIPAVVADLPTLRAHFSADEVLFFRAGDEDALARAIVEVAEDPDAARARAQAALRRYGEYRWEPNAERYVSVLDNAAEGRSTRERWSACC
jgi:glycosyltransferase involved in cell wall biosynthesis